MLTITIGGVDRSSLIRAKTMEISSILTSQVDQASFSLVSPDGSYRPQAGQEVVIIDEHGTRVFAGRILIVEEFPVGPTALGYNIQCADYTTELSWKLVAKKYENKTCKEIIDDIVATYLPPGRFTTNNVQTGPTIPEITFNYLSVDRCLTELAEAVGYEWYVDYDRDIHFFAKETNLAPMSLADGVKNYRNLRIKRDATQLRNRIYVRGASYWGNPITVYFAGDGKRRIWTLGYKCKDVQVWVNGIVQTVGIDNLHTNKDFYFTYATGRLRQDESGTVLTSADELKVTFTPEIPIRVVTEDMDAIEERKAIEDGDGIHEYLVVDERIQSKELARDRGKAEERMYARELILGRFSTFENGLRAGQILPVALTRHNLDDNFLIRQVTMRYAGDLDTYEYEVEFEN